MAPPAPSMRTGSGGCDVVRLQDGRIERARLLLEAVVEAALQGPARVAASAQTSTRRRMIEEHAAQIVDAVRVVGVVVREEHAVERARRARRAAARAYRPACRPARVVRPPLPKRSTSSAQRRRRFFGLAGSQAPQTLPTRGTPPEEPQPRRVNLMLMRPSAARGVLRRGGRSSRWWPAPAPSPRRP